MTAVPVPPIAGVVNIAPLAPTAPVTAGSPDFAKWLTDGIDAVNRKLLDADATVQAFALDDSIPVHQVTYALEQAKLSLELAMQVRARLLDGYQQLMNMQL
jgi:flagellar hook-basal body complex protein FliE